MSEKLKTGIIGCGKVAGIHAAALTTISRSAFTAVCGKDKKTQELRQIRGESIYQCLRNGKQGEIRCSNYLHTASRTPGTGN